LIGSFEGSGVEGVEGVEGEKVQDDLKLFSTHF
jgi:hypothetical protein